jgi:vacuolar-type H+-ATPase subunit F/Vma7
MDYATIIKKIRTKVKRFACSTYTTRIVKIPSTSEDERKGSIKRRERRPRAVREGMIREIGDKNREKGGTF